MIRKIDSVTRALSLFALPMLLGNILQSCYGMVDMAVVGRFVGRDALAAVGSTSMICFISNSICIGFTVGGNVLVARFRGANDTDAMRGAARATLALSALGGVLLTLLNYMLYKPMLRLMNVPSDAFPYAVEYMRVVCAGNVFVFGYNAVSAIMRGMGDSRRPLYFVAVTAAVNVLLDYLFVGVFRWGVGGAALATVIAQAASCLFALFTLKRRAAQDAALAFRFDRHMLKADAQIRRELFQIGIPTALRSVALNISYLVVTALFNGYGTAVAAAAGIGLKVNTFVAMPCWAAGSAVTTMAGHSMGAGDCAMAAKIARKGIVVSLLSTGLLLVLIQAFVRPFLGLFISDAAVIEWGVAYLRICCSINFIPYVAMYVFDCFATGVGAPRLAMFNTLLHSVVIRLGLSVFLTVPLDFGFMGLCAAESVSPLIPCVIGLVFFLRGGWRVKQV